MSISVPYTYDEGNVHVPFMSVHAQLDVNEEGTFTITAPVATGATALLAATAKAEDEETVFDPPLVVNNEFGRTVRVTSVEAGTLTIYGTNYLNEEIAQTVTLVAATAQDTLKAFKTIKRVVNGTADGNLSLGHGAAFGLPFVLGVQKAYYIDGAVQSAGTAVAADIDQDATAGDPRGTWAPAAGVVPNGTRTYEVLAKFRSTDAVGGLMGFTAA